MVVGTVAALAGLMVLNRRLEKVGEPSRLGGEEQRYPWRGGEPGYRVAGKPDAQPLLLVHGIYAGASSYEFRKNFRELSEDFRVYALDLLGCGLSDRPWRSYEPEDIAAQVEDFAREEIGAGPIDVQRLLVARARTSSGPPSWLRAFRRHVSGDAHHGELSV